MSEVTKWSSKPVAFQLRTVPVKRPHTWNNEMPIDVFAIMIIL